MATLVVLAGQSNAHGFNSESVPPPPYTPDQGLRIWKDTAFVTLNPGVNTGANGNPSFGAWGPETQFALDWRQSHPGETLYIVKVTRGQTGLAADPAEDDWSPATSGEMFSFMLTEIQQARASLANEPDLRVGAVLWMQGEQDATNAAKAAAYEANLADFFGEVREQWADAETGIYFGRIAASLPGVFAEKTAVRAAQGAVDGGDALAFMVDTDSFGLQADSIHFNGPGRQALGAAFYDDYSADADQAGGTGADTLLGRGGDDSLAGGGGNDRLFGGDGFDYLHGNAGADTANGRNGADWVLGGQGADSLQGDAGDDLVRGDADNDWVDGGSGADTVEGGLAHDRVFGALGADKLVGGDGDDTLSGGSGDDTAMGDAGNDVVDGGDAEDWLVGGIGDDSLTGAAGNDRLSGEDGFDTAAGEAGNDVVDGGLSGDLLLGGDGDDSLAGGGGGDTLSGQDGADTMAGDTGNDVMDGGFSADRLLGGSGDDTLAAGDGADSLGGDAGADTLAGGAGADIFLAGVGVDAERILDFAPTDGDRIRLATGTVYTTRQVAQDTLIEFRDDDVVTLVGVTAPFSTGWIVFG